MLNVLIADDEEDLLHALKIVFTKKGFSPITALTKDEVFTKIETEKPQVIILDVHLGSSDGRSICKEIKQVYFIPIILYSGYSNLNNAYKDYDADGFIEMPFKVSTLMEKVNNLVASYQTLSVVQNLLAKNS